MPSDFQSQKPQSRKTAILDYRAFRWSGGEGARDPAASKKRVSSALHRAPLPKGAFRAAGYGALSLPPSQTLPYMNTERRDYAAPRNPISPENASYDLRFYEFMNLRSRLISVVNLRTQNDIDIQVEAK